MEVGRCRSRTLICWLLLVLGASPSRSLVVDKSKLEGQSSASTTSFHRLITSPAIYIDYHYSVESRYLRWVSGPSSRNPGHLCARTDTFAFTPSSIDRSKDLSRSQEIPIDNRQSRHPTKLSQVKINTPTRWPSPHLPTRSPRSHPLHPPSPPSQTRTLLPINPSPASPLRCEENVSSWKGRPCSTSRRACCWACSRMG
jgi:hypothetical protein